MSHRRAREGRAWSPCPRARDSSDRASWSPIADWPGLATYLQHLYSTTAAGQALNARQASGLAAAARRAQARALAAGRPSPDAVTVHGAAAAPATATAPAKATAAYPANGEADFYAIQCADSLVPTRDIVYHNLAISEDARVPGFGRMVVYDAMPCATWPCMHTDAYDGPWHLSQTTILVINALHDPFTSYAGAQAAVSELGGGLNLASPSSGPRSVTTAGGRP